MILPVVGLLLLLGLFWYWASTLIGNDGNSPGATSTSAVAIVITPENPTATASTEANVPVQTAQAGTNGGAQTTGEATTPPAEATTPAATQGASTGGKFTVDQHVVTNDSVNLRKDPSTSADIITTLAAGTELVIVSGPEEADSYTWWEVTDPATGDDGFVAETFLDAQ